MKTGAILVDAGTETHTDLLPLSPAQRLTRTLQNAGVCHIVLLTPPTCLETLEKRMAHWGVLCLPDHIQGRTAALEYLGAHCGQLLLVPSDVPFVSPATVAAVLECGLAPVRPRCQELDGWPILVPADYFSALLHADLLDPRFPSGPAAILPAEDEGALRESLYAGKWPQLRSHRRTEDIHPTVKLRLCGERPFLGPGVAQLLSLIDITESVRMASQHMGISYSKAWKMISVLEEELEEAVVLRCQGGKNGGSARISPFGLELLEKYRRLEEECQAFARTRFHALFGAEPDGTKRKV